MSKIGKLWICGREFLVLQSNRRDPRCPSAVGPQHAGTISNGERVIWIDEEVKNEARIREILCHEIFHGVGCFQGEKCADEDYTLAAETLYATLVDNKLIPPLDLTFLRDEKEGEQL